MVRRFAWRVSPAAPLSSSGAEAGGPSGALDVVPGVHGAVAHCGGLREVGSFVASGCLSVHLAALSRRSSPTYDLRRLPRDRGCGQSRSSLRGPYHGSTAFQGETPRSRRSISASIWARLRAFGMNRLPAIEVAPSAMLAKPWETRVRRLGLRRVMRRFRLWGPESRMRDLGGRRQAPREGRRSAGRRRA